MARSADQVVFALRVAMPLLLLSVIGSGRATCFIQYQCVK